MDRKKFNEKFQDLELLENVKKEVEENCHELNRHLWNVKKAIFKSRETNDYTFRFEGIDKVLDRVIKSIEEEISTKIREELYKEISELKKELMIDD